MWRKKTVIMGMLTLSFILPCRVIAHTPLCSCYDNGDGSVTCEGGFSDGSSAAGVQMRVEDVQGKTLSRCTMDENSECTFKKPSASYKIFFDAGPGHVVEIDGNDIAE